MFAPSTTVVWSPSLVNCFSLFLILSGCRGFNGALTPSCAGGQEILKIGAVRATHSCECGSDKWNQEFGDVGNFHRIELFRVSLCNFPYEIRNVHLEFSPRNTRIWSQFFLFPLGVLPALLQVPRPGLLSPEPQPNRENKRLIIMILVFMRFNQVLADPLPCLEMKY